jgi:adenylate cyclase class 2
VTASGTETEIKIPVPELSPLLERLRAMGAVETKARHEEHNTLYDDSDGKLSRAGCTLRVRRAQGRGVLTFKGPASFAEGVKTREEIESAMDDPDSLSIILDRLGFVARFRYEKRRQELGFGGCTICLDETPIGCFVEVEGEVEKIAEALRRLGLDPKDAVRSSYAGLYSKARQKDRSLPPDMVFSI